MDAEVPLFDRHSPAQWKALVLAYPLYGVAARQSVSGQENRLVDPRSNEARLQEVEAHEVESFFEIGISKMMKVFHLTALQSTAGEERKESQAMPRAASSVGPEGSHRWRENVPYELDSLLSAIFGLDPLPRRSTSLPCESPAYRAYLSRVKGSRRDGSLLLTPSEELLLRLIYKERKRVDQYYNLFLSSREEVQLLRFQCTGAEDDNTKHPKLTKIGGTLFPWSYSPLPPAMSTVGDNTSQTAPGLLARGENDEKEPAEGCLPSHSSIEPANEKPLGSEVAVTPTRFPKVMQPMMMCEECYESTGDLYQCSQCQRVRHEACGGPRPPQSESHRHQQKQQKEKGEGSTATMLFCKRCSRDLGLMSDRSSSSSLRSSTSTDEREELGSLLEDTESSLSGFIVDSSEEESSSGRSASESPAHRSSKKRSQKKRARSAQNSSSDDDDDDERIVLGKPSREEKRKRKKPLSNGSSDRESSMENASADSSTSVVSHDALIRGSKEGKNVKMHGESSSVLSKERRKERKKESAKKETNNASSLQDDGHDRGGKPSRRSRHKKMRKT